MKTINKDDIVDVFCKNNKFQFTGTVRGIFGSTATVKHNNKKDNHIVPLTNLKKVFNDKAGH